MRRASQLCVLFVCTIAIACPKSGDDSAVRPDPKVRPPRPEPTQVAAKEPKVHRAKATACPKSGAEVDAHKKMAPTPGTPCSSDADCKDEKNGRCAAGGTCAYDECYVDGDCEKDRICVCRQEGKYGYRCLRAGNCRVDSDCGQGEFCSPSFDNVCGPYHGVIGYFCHTSKDECRDDDECKKDFSFGYCGYQPEVGHWACGSAMCKG